jgi:predicted transcriptional regulator
MNVSEVMTPNSECVGPEATLVNVLSDRDITFCCEGRDLRTKPVSGVRTLEACYCFEDDDIASAAELIQEKRVRRLLVLNRDKRLVGVVGLDDLLVKDCSEQMAGYSLEGISAPSSSNLQLAH